MAVLVVVAIVVARAWRQKPETKGVCRLAWAYAALGLLLQQPLLMTRCGGLARPPDTLPTAMPHAGRYAGFPVKRREATVSFCDPFRRFRTNPRCHCWGCVNVAYLNVVSGCMPEVVLDVHDHLYRRDPSVGRTDSCDSPFWQSSWKRQWSVRVEHQGLSSCPIVPSSSEAPLSAKLGA